MAGRAGWREKSSVSIGSVRGDLSLVQPTGRALCAQLVRRVNIRGGLYGVVDLAAFIAIDTGHARAEPAGQEPSVVTLNTALDVNCALSR